MSNVSPRKKAAAAAGFLAIAGTAVLGGTFAQFTDRDTTAVQELQAGTVQVDLTEGANWDTSDLLLAIDDTVERDVTVTNNGNLDIKAITLTANVVDTPGLDSTANLSEAVTVTIDQDGTALAEDVLLSELDTYNLDLDGALEPAATSVLTFTYKVVGTPGAGGAFINGDFTTGDREDFVTNPDNRFQDAKVAVDYTVDAIQRDGKVQ